MTVHLNVVLDQLVSPTQPELAMASRELAGALVAAAPAGCEVVALMPAGAVEPLPGVAVRSLTACPAASSPRRGRSGCRPGPPAG